MTDIKRATTVWDRWFNRDGPTGLAYREARAARREITATLARRLAEIRALEARLDRQIEPMMPRLDPAYEAVALVIERCAVAVRETCVMRIPISILVQTVRTATQPVRDDSARKEAEGARLRYPAHLAQASRASRGVKRAVDPVRAAVARAGVRSADLVWNGEILTRLPRTAVTLPAP